MSVFFNIATFPSRFSEKNTNSPAVLWSIHSVGHVSLTDIIFCELVGEVVWINAWFLADYLVYLTCPLYCLKYRDENPQTIAENS